MMKDTLTLDDVDMFEKWYGSWFQYMRVLKQYRIDKLPKRRWVTNIEVYHGTTGMGKSRRAWWNADKHPALTGIVIMPQSERDKFWGDGCVGAETIIMDDFGPGQISYQLLLRLLDRYPLVVEVKGTSMQWAPRTVYITSNLHPRLWYPARKWTGSPLKRRLEEFGFIERHTKEWFPPIIVDEVLDIIYPDAQPVGLPENTENSSDMGLSGITRTIQQQLGDVDVMMDEYDAMEPTTLPDYQFPK